jgi:hypothetical protein
MAGRAIGGAAGGCLGGIFSILALIALVVVGIVVWNFVGHVYYLFDGRAADAAAFAAKANVDLTDAEESEGDIERLLGPPSHVHKADKIVNATDYCWYRDCKVSVRALDGGGVVSLVIDNPGLYGDPVFLGTFRGLKIGGPAPGPGDKGGDNPGFRWQAKNGRITALIFTQETLETPAPGR